MISDDMDFNLREFFKWARINCPSDIGMPHQTPERALLGSTVSSPCISDEEAEMISKAIGFLLLNEVAAHRVLMRVYHDQKSLSWMENRGEGDRKMNGNYLARAIQFIRGVLFASTAIGSGR